MQPVEAVLVGAGQRGRDAMGAFAERHPDELKFIAVVEPDSGRREVFAKKHNIPKENQFETYAEFFQKPKIAPLCFIATMDREHFPAAMLALERGYNVMLEKPMTEDPATCLKLGEEVKKRRLMMHICHPLRFTNFYLKVRELLDSGVIGDIVSVAMSENVAYWHYAHSFVRGNWGKKENSGPFILTKCCHDMDIATWIGGAPVKRVSSSGTLKFFSPENAPKNSTMRCTDGCPQWKTCPFYAPAMYLTDYVDWPVSVISLDTGKDARLEALKKGPYGICVFKCGNNIVDNQVVNAEFENGATLSFAVYANTFFPYRSLRIIGTKGEMNGHLEKLEISINLFGQGAGNWYGNSPQAEVYKITATDGAHGGGDTGVIRNFLTKYNNNDFEGIYRSLDIAVEGHLLAFAAEKARESGEAVLMAEYKKSLQK